MDRFDLEVHQGGVWIRKGSYSTQQIALQGGRRRFPGMGLRLVDLESGNVVFTLSADTLSQPVEEDDYGFESTANIIGLVEADAKRIANTENWHQKLSRQRETRVQRLQEERLRERQRRLQAIPVAQEMRKVRKQHIKWWVHGF